VYPNVPYKFEEEDKEVRIWYRKYEDKETRIRDIIPLENNRFHHSWEKLERKEFEHELLCIPESQIDEKWKSLKK